MKEYKNKSSGFTLVETLSVVAIMVILLAFGIVGIVRHRDHLKITEMDNMAREIYMAAQNQAVLLQNSGRLKSELDETGAVLPDLDPVPDGFTEGTSYITWTGTATGKWDELLPVGTIDPALRKGKFYIVYEPVSGSVTDVFFVEKGDLPDIKDSFTYADEGRDSRMKNGPMLGWHHGDPADPSNTPLATPGVKVIIENGEELTLTVEYTLPDDLPDGVTLTRTPTVKLDYPGYSSVELGVNNTLAGRIPKIEVPVGKTSLDDISAGETISYTWVLDSLEKGTGGTFKYQFRELFGGVVISTFGDDFTVTASLRLTADDYIDSTYYAQDTNNSLFAKDTNYRDTDVCDASGNVITGANTARVANLRHLQNLNSSHSGVGSSIIKAEQIRDIDCKESKSNKKDASDNPVVLDPNYNFIPIVNEKLKSYDGKEYNISNLYVECTGNAGLFGEIKYTGIEPAAVQNVRLIDAVVSSMDSGYAGCLMGYAEKKCMVEDVEIINGAAASESADAGGLIGKTVNECNVKNCRVYWSESDKLIATTGTAKKINYKVSGEIAGGLVGSASGEMNIKNSFAATTVTGNTIGGLIGSTENVKIDNSYTDCYLLSSSSSSCRIGGMIGKLVSGKEAKLTNCYAAGFIMTPKESDSTAGLVENTVGSTAVSTVNANKVYSIVRVVKEITKDGKTATQLERPKYSLYATKEGGSLKPVEDDFHVASYQRYLIKVSYVTDEVKNQLGSMFEYDDTKKTKDQSHIYNLAYTLWDDKQKPFKTCKPGVITELESPYSYPELKYEVTKDDGTIETLALPHYGDWADLNTPAGLAYYEEYSESYKDENSDYEASKYGAMGYYEDTPIDTMLPDDKAIQYDAANRTYSMKIDKDGYALVFEVGNDPVHGDKYYVEYGNSNTQTWMLEKVSEDGDEKPWTWKWTKYIQNADGTWEAEKKDVQNADGTTSKVEIGQEPSSFEITNTKTEKTYMLIPLPDKVVTGVVPEGDNLETKFYQKLTAYENTYYFNPHFAKTVEQGNVKEPDEPTNLDNDHQPQTHPDMAKKILIRTPRHFYALSRFQRSYVGNSGDKKYYFKQELDLDYETYGWYGENQPTAPTGTEPYYKQEPIGNQLGATYSVQGVYDGGKHTIRNVFYSVNGDALQYIGLFQYINFLWDITYEVPDNITVLLNNALYDGAGVTLNNGFDDGIKVGTLAGGAFVPHGCTVKIKHLTIRSTRENIYAGGLFGFLNGHPQFWRFGRMENNHAEIESLTVKGTGDNSAVYAGGLVGLLYQHMRDCTSRVEHMTVTAEKGYAYAGGLVGRSSRNTEGTRRTIESCSAEVGTLSVTGKSVVSDGRLKTYDEIAVYAGGLAGWCDVMKNCSAVVKESLTATGTDSSITSYIGGLAGGGCEIENCTAAVIVRDTVTQGKRYVGGLVGAAKYGNCYTQDLLYQDNSHVTNCAAVGNITSMSGDSTIGGFVGKDDVTGRIKNCYAAVGVPDNKDAFCGEPKNNIENCYYLSGSWKYKYKYKDSSGNEQEGTYDCSANSTNIVGGVKAITYGDLVWPADTLALGDAWGKAQNNNYPFPVSTRLLKKDESGKLLYYANEENAVTFGDYYYPGTYWPVDWQRDIDVGLVHYHKTGSDEYTIISSNDVGHDTCEGEAGYALRFKTVDMKKWKSVEIKYNVSEDVGGDISGNNSGNVSKEGSRIIYKDSIDASNSFNVGDDTFIKIPADNNMPTEGNFKITITIESIWPDPDSEGMWKKELTFWINSEDHTISETELAAAVSEIEEEEPEEEKPEEEEPGEEKPEEEKPEEEEPEEEEPEEEEPGEEDGEETKEKNGEPAPGGDGGMTPSESPALLPTNGNDTEEPDSDNSESGGND